MNWEKVKLKDVCVSITDGTHQAPPKSNVGVPFITISNFDSYNALDFSDTNMVLEDFYDNQDDYHKAAVGDILYSVVGSFGKAVLIKEFRKFVFQRHIAILRPSGNINGVYLYYVLSSKSFYKQADLVALGAAQRTISLTSLRNMEILLPPRKVQDKIASILSTYDNLIDNCRKQISLLEEATQRLYKEWFVDFRFPGHESVAIVDGLPEGWKRGIISDLVKQNGKSIRKNERENYECYVPIDVIPKKSLAYIDANSTELAESSLLSFEPSDIIFGSMRVYFHKVCIARHRGLTRSTCFVLNANDKSYYHYIVMLLFSEQTIDMASKASTGTTMPYIKWPRFAELPIIIPDTKTVISFGRITAKIFVQINNFASQIKSLITARDLLLPRLMSGEIEIKA